MMNERLWTKDFINISLSGFFTFLVFNTFLTTLPVFVIDNLGQNKSQVGLVITVFLIASVIIRPFAGLWIDSIGRKKIFLYSLAFFTITTFFYLFIENFTFFLILRFAQGIVFGLATTASGTVLADIVPAKRRGEGISYYGLAMILAMVFGPYIGITIINNYNFSFLFIVCSILAVFPFIFGASISIPNQTQKKEVKLNKIQLVESSALPISITAAIISFGYSGVISFITLYAKEMGFVKVASIFFIVFAVVTILTRPITGKLFDQKGPNIIIYPGIFIFSVGLLILSFSSIPLVFLVSAAFIGLGYGSIVPSFQTLAINAAKPERKGIATATFLLFFDIGIGLGSFLLGMITAKTSFHAVYVISGIVSFLAIITYYFLHDRKQRRTIISASKAG